MKARNVRMTLTMWYVAAMVVVLIVYSACLLIFVNQGASRSLDNRLRGDFRWAAEMAEQKPDGTLSWFEGAAAEDEDLPWLQVWTPAVELVFRTAVAERQTIPDSNRLAALADNRIVTVPTSTVPFRVLSGQSKVGGKPVILQVARSEAGMRRTMRDLLITLMLSLPLAVAAAGIGGYVLARRALAPVEESFEQMRRFTADVSHELRTPLTAIRSVGEVALRERQHDVAAYRSTIGSMLEDVDRLALLVDRLLALSRAETGLVKLSVEPIDLRELAEDVVAHLGVLAEEKRQSLTIDAAAGGRCAGDRVVLRQALINLVDNAIKYTPVGGDIRIRISETGGGATLDVIDSGPGVGADAATRIFNRFDRGSRSRSEDSGGAGLGLAIAKWAVEVSGGRLSLVTATSAGSTFRIALPGTQQ